MPESQENKKTFSPKHSISNFVKRAFSEAGLTRAVNTVGLIPISTGFLQPGDVIAFNYRAEGAIAYSPVVVLIVQTKLSSGTRISRGTGNRLITCYKIENDQNSKGILKKLYKNRVKSRLDKGLIGVEDYRTYIMDSAHISNMMELTLNTGAL